jgi:hypothetical protein
MITIASNYAAADDDARESLKASAIQNTGKRNNSNKRKNPLEEQQTPDMVATTFADKGQSSQRGQRTRYQQWPAAELYGSRFGAFRPHVLR